MADEGACGAFTELIPWVAAGSASAKVKARLYMHTAACERCRRDLAGALALRVSVSKAVTGLPAAPDGLFARLPGPRESATDLLRRMLPWLDEAGLPASVSGPVRWALEHGPSNWSRLKHGRPGRPLGRPGPTTKGEETWAKRTPGTLPRYSMW
jgi:hypothetical protein